jgi:hypothetical protein
MAFERARWLCLLMLCACASEPRFPLRPVMWRDDDRTAFAPAPAEYVSPFAWDGADQMVFRPVARFFAVDPAGRATDVNALDEVPDSSWFENRIGQQPFTPDDIVSGPCGEDVLDVNLPPGSWVIDQGKANGANPGFRVNIPGVGKFLLKADPNGEPQRATGATAIAARLYHAAGYFAPCDSVVYFDPRILHLTPGLTTTDNTGIARPFDQAALDSLLDHASHRAGLVRMGASRWLPGKPIGPARYEGTRDDDPNDVVPHEDRRELRGARLMAAWLNHFDSREQNTMDVFMPLLQGDRADAEHRLGHVRHYILDLGDCFGSVWASDELSRRLGHTYYLDFSYLLLDFVSLGAANRPWERARRDGGIFNYFSARDFDPEDWRGGYPNPAFVRMTEADGAWMARILARFDDALIAAAVSVGQYDPPSSEYLVRTLIARRDLILQRYLTRLSPLAELRVRGRELCGVDLARRTHVVSQPAPPHARLLDENGPRALPTSAVHWDDSGELCVALPPLAAERPEPRQPAYGIVEITTGTSRLPLRAHVYDRGAAGLWLAGIERD